MTNRFNKTLTVTGCLLALSIACAQTGKPTLKQAYEKKFLIGAAVNPDVVSGKDSLAQAIVKAQFNTVTPENALKWEPIHPKPGVYNFGPADAFVEFAVKNGMAPIGHTLVWHAQTPRSVFQDGAGKPTVRDTLLARMHEHILTVVGRYKGRIHGWDVVNEAFEDDGALHKSPWLSIIGEDFIQKAFEYAHEADPNVELYYNDYNVWKPGKTAAVIKLVKDLRAKGVRVDAVGEQAHWGFNYPTMTEAETLLKSFKEAGIKLMITEMDISVLPNPWDYQGADIAKRFELTPEMNPYPNALPDSVQTKLAGRYADLFGLFCKYADNVTRVTLWGVDDGHSWLNFFPVRGRTNYPLFFDRQYKPKPAFDAVIEAAK
jgi:endo-1,4-beta-xylanase